MINYDAIVYGWTNIENGKKYVGFHRTQNEYDNYIFSSDNYELRDAWSHGLLHKCVIWRGTEFECLTLERYILNKVNAVSNPMWYNRSNGGGMGLRNVWEISKEAIAAADTWLETGELPAEDDSDFIVADHTLSLKIKERIETGYYQLTETNVQDLSLLPRNQVRFEEFDPNHVKDIYEKMISNPTKARENVSPVVVVVENHRKMILDGNHTATAAYKAGWTSIPAVYINSADFNDSQANYDDFGILMNHREKLKKTNTADDCKKAIINLHDRLNIDFNSYEFQRICIANLSRYWSEKQVIGNLTYLIKKANQEETNAKFNFKTWTNTEVVREVKRVDEAYHGAKAVIGITSDKCFNAGVGAVLNKMGEKGVTDAIMVISHTDYDNYLKRHDHERKLKNALKLLREDIVVNIEYLPCFINTKTNVLKVA